ncbi:MAG: IS1595 family transposase [Alphaproteobacteria bacterium]
MPGGVIQWCWSRGWSCLSCGHGGHCHLKKRGKLQCNRCKHQVSVTAGTIFHSTKLPLKVWFLAIYHVSQSKGGISSADLGRRLGVREATAWLTKQKIMAALHGREKAKPKPKGRVEMDDAYLGGARSGGKRGRGAAGKTPFIAAVETTIERRPRRIKLKIVKGFRKKEVERLAKAEIEPRSSAVSDGLSCWPAVPRRTLPRLSGRPGKVHRAGLVIGSKAWSGVLQPSAE